MLSPVDIANRALSDAAARASISSFDENSSEAQAVAQYYDAVRDQVMRAARWPFARKTALLTLLKAAPGTPESTVSTATTWSPAYPPMPWFYSYAYPADCVAFWRVQRNNNPQVGGVPMFAVPSLGNAWGGPTDDRMPARFEVASDDDGAGNPHTVILTSEAKAIGIYSRRIEDPAIWDALYTEAVVQGLSGRLAMAVSGDKGLMQLRYRTANDAILAARVAAGNEGGNPNMNREASWQEARAAGVTMPGVEWSAYGPLFPVS